AWLDWAGLRPMTEFEFEKMARGPELPVAGEFAWGTDLIVDANSLMDDGHSTEYVTDLIDAGAGIASHGYAGPKGGLRNGFAGRDNSDRMKAGAGYYGVLELSGNLWELTINMLPEGLTFTGNHGDGNLIDGQSDAGWPGVDGGGFRGGAWNSGIGPIGFFRDLAISDRWYAGLGPTDRRFTNGIRGVRTAE
ncbi:MAG: sulfatase activating formylglycine-generating enzyme, partial [Limisphaerales bacterium]